MGAGRGHSIHGSSGGGAVNYSDAIAKLESEQTCDWSKTEGWIVDPEDDGLATNYVIAKEVGGALAEGVGNRISFGTFDNCREWGLTFEAGDWTFCCYEHRNSDQIHIEGNLTDCIETWGPYGGADKFDTMFSAGWQKYQVITAALSRVIVTALAGELESREQAIRILRSDQSVTVDQVPYVNRRTRDGVNA